MKLSAPEQITKLITAAQAARLQAYAPYSGFAVGAAVLAEDGRIFTGVNVENASYSMTICAERAAVFAAITHGARRLQAIALVSDSGATPCGACRQVLSEFAGADFKIFAADAGGDWETFLSDELWPFMFGKHDLAGGG